MSNVYRIGHYNGTWYFRTRRDAERFKPNDEEPDSFDMLDAAQECTRLHEQLEKSERALTALRVLLDDLHDECEVELEGRGRNAWNAVNEYRERNPLPSVTQREVCRERAH